MSADLSVQDISPILKEQYIADLDRRILMRDHPFLALVSKKENFHGRHWHLPIQWNLPTGRSHTFADAQGNRAGSEFENWVIPRVSDHAVARISGESVETGEGADDAIFLDSLKNEFDSALMALGASIAHDMYGSSGGSRGQIGTDNTTSWTLATTEDVVFFAVNMVVELSLGNGDAGGDVLKAGTATIDKIDEDLGILTITLSGLTPADDDFIFVAGDFKAAPAGLASWLPDVSPAGGDSFFTVDRSVNPARLAGIRYDGTSDAVDDFYINALARGRRSNAKPTHVFTNPANFAQLEKALEDRKRIQRITHGQYSDIGFDALALRGGLSIIEDPDCPVDTAYFLDMTTIQVASLGKLGKIVDEDNLTMLRVSDADAYEFRMNARWAMGIRGPGMCIVGATPPVT